MRRTRARRRRLHTLPTGRQRLVYSLAPIVVMTAVGTIGFWLIEPWGALQSLYMAVVTISTVGAYDQPLSDAGRAFAVVLVMLGVTTVGYALFSINSWLLEGTIMELMGQRRLGRELRRLKDHIIVCGAGRIGGLVAEDLLEAGASFVVIEHNPERVRELLEKDILAMEGGAGDEEVLLQAGIERASTLISVVRSDAENLYITITARSLNPNLKIVARAEDAGTVNKLRRVGATKVIAPYHLGALRIVNAVLRPALTDVIEMTLPGSAAVLGLQIAEVLVKPNSRLAGQTLKASGMRQELGVIVIAIRPPQGETNVNPTPEAPIVPGSLLVAIGTQEQLDRLTEWAGR